MKARFSILFTPLFLFLFTLSIHAQPKQLNKIKKELKKVEQDKSFTTGFIGFCLMDTESGKVLVESNSQKSFTTASTMKLVTTGAALALLGDTFRFKTEIGYEGGLTDGTLFGNIKVVGTGDPTIGSNRWAYTNIDTINKKISHEIAEKKITQITGYVRTRQPISASKYTYLGVDVPPGYNIEDTYYPYGASPSEINIFENVVNEHTRVFSIPDYEVRNRWLYFFEVDDHTDKCIKLNTTFPYSAIDSLTYLQYGENAEYFSPESIFSTFLKFQLLADGIKMSNNLQSFEEPNMVATYPLTTIYSPPLLDIATKTNENSINLYAECILRAIGIQKYGPSTLDTSLAITQRFWLQEVGDTKGLRMTDGSGLSRNNLCTPLLFCKMLKAYTNRPNFDSFYSTLAVAGKSGTVKNFGVGTLAEGNARIKTGTMSRVKTFAGYVTGKDSKLYSFALMFNNFEPDASPTDAARKIIPLIAGLKNGKSKRVKKIIIE